MLLIGLSEPLKDYIVLLQADVTGSNGIGVGIVIRLQLPNDPAPEPIDSAFDEGLP